MPAVPVPNVGVLGPDSSCSAGHEVERRPTLDRDRLTYDNAKTHTYGLRRSDGARGGTLERAQEKSKWSLRGFALTCDLS